MVKSFRVGPRFRVNDAAVLEKQGRLLEPGGVGPTDDGFAQKGGGPVIDNGLTEVAAL